MARPNRNRTTMCRISKELDSFLNDFAIRLTGEMGRPISKTEASRLLAATQRPPIIVDRRRAKVLIRGSLISL